ncbi:hypothetical protein H2198_002737 [Neophaeococcomyces mojaviensis]|uniref:Uncharacterized protein n=1 Tax=Neophaeococcomyces mojaviensis TaxID=3383035 RepID=A0ACC3ADM8_9EURO|nr:hypothetical protein H2198_002737 [Knufia sp. JES_112]
MGDATVNGDFPPSATVDHVTKYPLVKDSIDTFKSYPIGQYSIDITNSAYANFVKPTFPYLEKPAAYAKPYVAKADEIGDTILTKVDEKVPILKSETKDIQKQLSDYAYWPFKAAGEQKDYVLKTYSDEYKKCGGDGVVAGGKALVSGSFVITSEWLAYFSTLLQKKKEQAKGAAEDAKKTVEEKTSDN